MLIVINAEIADGKDTSWLWDVPFERLQGRQVIASGRRCHDLAVRLLYADVDVVTEPDLDRALALARADDRDVVANYTAFREVRRALGVGTMTRESAVRIAIVLPELLGTYGDGGNGIILEHRLRWRGIAVERIDCGDAAAIPDTADLYLLGGGEDRPQTLAARELRASGAVNRAHARGAVIFAVCAGYQIVGRAFPGRRKASKPGLGLLDVTTTVGAGPRAVGELLIEPDAALDLPLVSGFENHQGVTSRRPRRPCRSAGCSTASATVLMEAGPARSEGRSGPTEGALPNGWSPPMPTVRCWPAILCSRIGSWR